MRRFSSEGSLLDLDFLPWRKVDLRSSDCQSVRGSGLYIPQSEEGEPVGRPGATAPIILEPRPCPDMGRRKELSKELSISAENLNQHSSLDKNHLGAFLINEGCRAYSDGQLAPGAQGSTENMSREDEAPPSPSSKHRHHHRAKLSAAKLHLKSLFGQSPHSSHSNLSKMEESVSDRRSRLLFMRQWSQVGHSKKRVSREELDKWAESLNALLESHSGVAVFGAFLRSEFSEENLQFYLACEQYKQSSNNFSLQRRARDITNTYIKPGAPREVNLDSKTRDLTLQLLQAPSHSSLCHAQRRIYSLLDTDCYPRFLQSSMYLSLRPEHN